MSLAKRMVLMALALALTFGALFGWKAFVGQQIRLAMAASGPPVATVSTDTVSTDAWVPELATVATLRSAQSVDISAQLAGQITRLHFDSGDEVARGDLLAEQFVADERAQLKALQADLRLAELEVQRIDKLVQDKLVPKRELDAATSKLDRVRAEVENVQVAIAKKSIRAPFNGRLGIRPVNIGQYIEPGDKIARLESFGKLYADFKLPQQSLAQVQVGQAVYINVDAWPEKTFGGRITAIEPAVDPATRNISLRATVDPADNALRPGMFGEIRVALPAKQAVLLLPQSAISFSPFGNSVFVVDTSDQGAFVRNVYVDIGETRGDLVTILGGLQAGQEVVVSGHHKLRDGAAVKIDNSIPVNADATPNPGNS